MGCEGSILFSLDSSLITSGSSDETVKLWDANAGKCAYTFEEHNCPVNSVLFPPDGALLVSGFSVATPSGDDNARSASPL